VRLIEEAHTVNENLRAFFVLNQYQANRILAAEVVEVLSLLGPGVMTQRLGSREVYRQSPLHGGTVQSLAGS